MTPTRALLGILGLCLLGAASGCAVNCPSPTSLMYPNDDAITAAVQQRLGDSRSIHGAAVHVETLDGSVALSGMTASAGERAQVEALTRSVKGVRTVRNRLAIQP